MASGVRIPPCPHLRKELLDEYILNGWKLGRTNYKPRKNSQGNKIKN